MANPNHSLLGHNIWTTPEFDGQPAFTSGWMHGEGHPPIVVEVEAEDASPRVARAWVPGAPGDDTASTRERPLVFTHVSANMETKAALTHIGGEAALVLRGVSTAVGY